MSGSSRRGPLLGPFFLLLAMQSLSVAADEYRVWFDNGDEGRIEIGTLQVDGLGTDNGYRFDLNDDGFGDYFLSMRPFKCIKYTDKMFCYLNYPYENRRNISADDLTDLEYDLLFIARSPTEYGIDPWNGRYFHLRWEGDRIIGAIHETDLDILAAPPDDGSLRPLADADMVPVAAGDKQWTPVLVIEPQNP